MRTRCGWTQRKRVQFSSSVVTVTPVGLHAKRVSTLLRVAHSEASHARPPAAVKGAIAAETQVPLGSTGVVSAVRDAGWGSNVCVCMGRGGWSREICVRPPTDPPTDSDPTPAPAPKTHTHTPAPALPEGLWAGTAVIPTSANSKGCISPIPSESIATLRFNSNTVVLTTLTLTGSVERTVTLTSVVQYPSAYEYYYVGLNSDEGTNVPVCFLFDHQSGTYAMQLNGIGTCPMINSVPSCVESKAAVDVEYIATGMFSPQGV